MRSVQASQQTNFGRVLEQPGLPAAKASFIWDVFLYVCLLYSSASGQDLALSGLPALSRKKNFSKSHMINPSLTKLARSRWIFWVVVNNLVGYCLHVKFKTRIICILRNSAYVLSKLIPTQAIRPWTNGKCLATKHHQTLFGDQKFYRLDTLFWCCLVVFDKIWRPSSIRSKT